MQNLMDNILKTGRVILTVDESKEVLFQNGFPVNKSVLITHSNQIPEVCKSLHFPLVMKIVSPQITHKTDVGGVILNLQSIEQVISNYNSLISSLKLRFPSYDITGVVLEEQIPNGLEFIAGVVNDKVFGHCLMFGIGGIFVELVNDISFRLIPASKTDVASMIDEIKFGKVLDGIRGNKFDKDMLHEVLLKLSSFVYKNRKIISEIDLNPIIVTNDYALIVDARIILKND